MSKAPSIHPEMAELIAAKCQVPNVADPEALRASWDAYGKSLRRPYPDDMVVTNTTLADSVGQHLISVRIYRPSKNFRRLPCVLYFHGGAFIKGSLDSGDTIAWGICDQVQAVTISVDYRLAPEFPFPAAVDDCYSVLRHVATQGSELGIDPERLAVWGDSAGGNLATATCLMARDKGGPRIVAQVLNYPCLTDELTAPSYQSYAASPGLTTASLDAAWTLYLRGQRPTTDYYAAPLKAPDLSGLPAANINIAEIDPLADDGLRYAMRLRAAGTPVDVRCAAGMIHGFLRARFAGPAAEAAFSNPCTYLKERLR